MQSFQNLSSACVGIFDKLPFPETPATLYDPAKYFLQIGGKRIRPAMCLMGNELFSEIHQDTYHVAAAIEMFHNFSLVHDDIMDNAALRRGIPTIHAKYGPNTALLTGDVMMISAYEYLNKIDNKYKTRIFSLFNRTTREVCEGQQWDMDFEKRESVSMGEYLHMIELKTSVLLAASLTLGAIIGGATENNLKLLYEFGRNLGIAFQIQDDYLDAFGNPDKFGKEIGGDIRQNKKTFLLIQALETAPTETRKKLLQLMKENPANKVQQVLAIFKECNIDKWAGDLQKGYYNKALCNLEEIIVPSLRKEPLRELADYLLGREY